MKEVSFTSEELNKLDCMNYHVSVPNEGFYYLCDGVEGLARSRASWNIELHPLMRGLLDEGQVECETGHVITMI
jgi:hypothetical protein